MVTPAKKTSKCAAVWGRARGLPSFSADGGSRADREENTTTAAAATTTAIRAGKGERGRREAKTDAEFVRCAEGLRKLP